jgi:hypothetical protein
MSAVAHDVVDGDGSRADGDPFANIHDHHTADEAVR